MKAIADLGVKIFADGADLDSMLRWYREPFIRGFTTNPTLMHKAGVRDYRRFAQAALDAIPDRPISFEVFSDDFEEMYRQACEISSWGENVFVKIPVSNTRREPAFPLIRRLSHERVKVNVTAVLTLEQVRKVTECVTAGVPCYVSVFGGRIADTGRDPITTMSAAAELVSGLPGTELIWASTRELLNIFQADATGCHIITLTDDILKKLALVGKDLEEFSLETVRMFRDDAQRAGYRIELAELAAAPERGTRAD